MTDNVYDIALQRAFASIALKTCRWVYCLSLLHDQLHLKNYIHISIALVPVMVNLAQEMTLSRNTSD